MNFSRDVWSKVFEHTHPLDPVPAPSDETLKGETTIMGTRTPRPMGPAIPPAEAGRGSTVRYSPPVPAGGVGGETWSNHPSFSSYMMNRTVRAQTSLLVRSALMTSDVYHSPKAGGAGGCSSNPTGGMIHEGVVDRRVQGFPYEHIPAVLLSLARQGKGSYPSKTAYAKAVPNSAGAAAVAECVEGTGKSVSSVTVTSGAFYSVAPPT